MSDTENRDFGHTHVSGAINQHTPSYWRLALPALGVRYAATFFRDWSNIKTNKYFDAAAGLWMMGITFFFANRTRRDMLSMFSETVAYEMGKPPENITTLDLFRSENKAVITARNNLLKYTGVRTLVNSSFFASFSRLQPFQKWKPLNETSAINLGMGMNSAYLTYEVLGRGRTFFEQAQSFVDSKLNKKNEYALGEDVKSSDLIHLYERNAVENDPAHAFRGKVDGEVWKQSHALFERMATLMNHTYQQKHDGDRANFTMPKFIYLLGHNLIQPHNVQRTLAYIEIANSYGMTALKQVVQEVSRGTPLENVLAPYPLAVPAAEISSPEAGESTGRKYSETLMPAARIAAPPTSYAEKTALAPATRVTAV